MSEHAIHLSWKRATEGFAYEEYNRSHEIDYGEGIKVPSSAAPEYRGEPRHVDPERAFVGALSSCHMLTFLALCCKKRFVVDSYEDDAVGFLEKNGEGKLAITRVVLKPRITFSGDKKPSVEDLEKLHHQAHEHCFIANSVTTEVTIS